MTELAPGIYEAISSERYHAQPYCSNSRLTLLKRSPAHLRADLDNPGAPTDAMRLGTAIHSAVLEPDDFESRYTVGAQCAAELASGKRKGERCTHSGTARWAGEWFCGQHRQEGEPDAIEVLTRSEWLACQGVRRSLWAHPKLRKLLDAPGRAELTVIWDDPETGVRCKARVDRLCEDYGGVLLDLKTTTDARPWAFEKKIHDMGYHRQKAMYQDALRLHGIETQHLVIAAAEKEGEPYAVAGYRLSDGAADVGRDELRALIRRYAECQEKQEWPAYPTDIVEIALPAYAYTQEIAA